MARGHRRTKRALLASGGGSKREKPPAWLLHGGRVKAEGFPPPSDPASRPGGTAPGTGLGRLGRYLEPIAGLLGVRPHRWDEPKPARVPGAHRGIGPGSRRPVGHPV